MKFNLKINGSEDKNAEFVGWTPVKCTLTIEGYNGNSPMPVTVTPEHKNKSGRINLYLDNATTAKPVQKVEHDFQSENELTFYVAGKFDHASVTEKDTFILVKHNSDPNLELKKEIMVRVRKNANDLTPQEIEDFLLSFLELSQQEKRGSYSTDNYTKIPERLLDEIIMMHTIDASNEIHRRTSFHPWHRVFQMHIEREIQKNHPHVTIPYWKFDDKAPNVFTENFIGKTEKTNANLNSSDLHYGEQLSPKFDAMNPIYTYSKHIFWGGALKRAYRNLNPVEIKPDRIMLEEELICGGDENLRDRFSFWSSYEEVNSHNRAHYAFTGNVVDIGKDPVDPLFFMMHANVDRLWALWQHEYQRYNGSDEKTYPYQGKYTGERGEAWAKFRNKNDDGFYNVGNCDIGNFAEDTLWPWDLDHELGRPMREWKSLQVGYGTGKVPQLKIKFPDSLTSSYPNGPLTVKSTIDFQGRVNNENAQGFDYDCIPYFDHDKKPYCKKPMENIQINNETFLNSSFTVSQRMKAANHSFLRTADEQIQLMKILKDSREENQIRIKSIGLIDESKADFLNAALEIIANENESVELRSELIHFVFASKRSNPHFPSYKPLFFDLLRGLMKSPERVLRIQAIEILAANSDEVVQDFLIQELKKDHSEFISKPDAIFFLRENPKPQHAKFFRELFEDNQAIEIKKAAIEGLGNDPNSVDFLKKVIQDETASFKIREAGALSLHHLDKNAMNELAAQIISKPEPGDGIKLFRSASPDPDEVDFKAGLLNMLTFTGDVNKLKNNEELKTSLREVNLPSTQNKANFKTTLETFTDKSLDLPTILEQMSKKLLTRIEADSNE